MYGEGGIMLLIIDQWLAGSQLQTKLAGLSQTSLEKEHIGLLFIRAIWESYSVLFLCVNSIAVYGLKQ